MRGQGTCIGVRARIKGQEGTCIGVRARIMGQKGTCIGVKPGFVGAGIVDPTSIFDGFESVGRQSADSRFRQ